MELEFAAENNPTIESLAATRYLPMPASSSPSCRTATPSSHTPTPPWWLPPCWRRTRWGLPLLLPAESWHSLPVLAMIASLHAKQLHSLCCTLQRLCGVQEGVLLHPAPANHTFTPLFTQAGKRFDVVVVDSRPLLEGRRMLAALLEGGVTCEYCHLNALSYQITEVDKVRRSSNPACGSYGLRVLRVAGSPVAWVGSWWNSTVHAVSTVAHCPGAAAACRSRLLALDLPVVANRRSPPCLQSALLQLSHTAPSCTAGVPGRGLGAVQRHGAVPCGNCSCGADGPCAARARCAVAAEPEYLLQLPGSRVNCCLGTEQLAD